SSLTSGTDQTRANANEALETMVPPQMAALISRLFDPALGAAELLEVGKQELGVEPLDAKQAFHDLLHDQTYHWFRAVSALVLGEMGAKLSPASQPSKELRGRRKPPSDLLGMFAESSPAKATPVPEPAANGTLFKVDEIKQMLAEGSADTMVDVRTAANAAQRIMDKRNILELARQEEK